MERSALAPVSFFIAFSAMASRASSANSNFTSSSSRSFWYCFKIAFFGSVKILTSISLVRPCRVKIMGRRPINSGIIPNLRISSTVTLESRFSSLSKASFNCALKPMLLCFVSLSLIISSRSGNAPPQINKILRVLMVVSGTMAFLLLAPTGTSTSAPSSSFNIPCCTDSPLTSRLLVFFFLAILSISSIKTMPFSALSVSLPAAARSLEMTLSISSPI